MSIRGVTARGRRRTAQVRHNERIVIDRGTTSTDVDEDGNPAIDWEVIYDGPGRLHTFRPHEQNSEVGGGTVTQQRVDWHIPDPSLMAGLLSSGRVSAWRGPVQTGDRARLLTPGVPSKTVRIAGEFYASNKTEQRFTVDEITGGAWSQGTP